MKVSNKFSLLLMHSQSQKLTKIVVLKVAHSKNKDDEEPNNAPEIVASKKTGNTNTKPETVGMKNLPGRKTAKRSTKVVDQGEKN